MCLLGSAWNENDKRLLPHKPSQCYLCCCKVALVAKFLQYIYQSPVSNNRFTFIPRQCGAVVIIGIVLFVLSLI